ncbi:MFS transporter [Denitrificimonas sp. JX-1]|uniref:MFS transporter n=1 Tax=Denitrificimonas halotolerans TaxID=3098930 RepID=A0ABU5GRJ8_9GAMM|nr:MFS transporter [Denitrificimonas sp. JX-1]MDY7218248.1 MFS transporter [Denitrificimonas sp. JX-1]
MLPTSQKRKSPSNIKFIFLMILIGLNLRPALSSLAPLLPRIENEGTLSVLTLSLLTALPVLCLGLFAPLAPWLTRQLGIERSLTIGLIILSAGLALRGIASIFTLYLGTLMLGSAIGIIGTLLPALVKRELTGSADIITGVYTMALCLGGALGAAFSIPIANLLNSWSLSLFSWSCLALTALIAWWWIMPQPAAEPQFSPHKRQARALLNHPLAWQVMLLMGSQSSLAYIVFGWLPTLLVRQGYSESEAGWLMSISILVQAISAIAAPWFARISKDQRPALLVVFIFIGVGLVMLLLGPTSLRWPGSILLGLGQGGSFSLALTLIVLRSGDAKIAGDLSALAQGGGYTIAAIGPLIVGLMIDANIGIYKITWVLFAILGFATYMALLAGQQRRLEFNQQGQLVTIK